MGVRDLFHRTLVYFGLAEDESMWDDEEVTAAHNDLDRTYRERPNVRRVERERGGRRRGNADELFAEEPEVVRRTRRTAAYETRDSGAAATAVLRPQGGATPLRDAMREPGREPVTTAVKVHLIAPRSFNDAQQIADRFKNAVPVIINMQSAEPELAKRLIDFGSGLTYALDGGMQRIAEKVFLLTPHNVEVSAEDRARLVEQGFFNPS
jgi:cell division inhibitor SepF